MKPPAFSALTVCGLDELDRHSGRGVTHVLSILDPDWPEPQAFQDFDPHFRATLRFHDAIEPGPRVVLPQKPDVDAILAFGRDAGDERHLLIHCHAGLSRSTAAMLMILAQAHPHEPEDVVVGRLLQIRPQAWPNSRMIGFADERLGRDGRLSAAIVRIYAARLETAARPRGNDAQTKPGEGGRTRPWPDDVSARRQGRAYCGRPAFRIPSRTCSASAGWR